MFQLHPPRGCREIVEKRGSAASQRGSLYVSGHISAYRSPKNTKLDSSERHGPRLSHKLCCNPIGYLVAEISLKRGLRSITGRFPHVSGHISGCRTLQIAQVVALNATAFSYHARVCSAPAATWLQRYRGKQGFRSITGIRERVPICSRLYLSMQGSNEHQIECVRKPRSSAFMQATFQPNQPCGCGDISESGVPQHRALGLDLQTWSTSTQ